MRPLRLAGCVESFLRAAGSGVALTMLASCAAGSSTASPATSSDPSASATATDGPKVTVHGPVPITVVSTQGPTDPVGPFAAVNLTMLRAMMAAASPGRPVACRPGPCWSEVTPNSQSLYVVFNPSAQTVCFQMHELTTAIPVAHTLRIDVTVVNDCDRGGGAGSRPRGRDAMLAVPLHVLGAGEWTVVIRERTPSTQFENVGHATAMVPAGS
ncbi:MAG: hypothetical protein QOC82_3072 [Frankiaceae bacterium]|jgi:hypothetical protein|nr:hypothetical protein [Frankiaceae bacterium]